MHKRYLGISEEYNKLKLNINLKIDNFPEFNRREIANNKMPSIYWKNIRMINFEIYPSHMI